MKATGDKARLKRRIERMQLELDAARACANKLSSLLESGGPLHGHALFTEVNALVRHERSVRRGEI